MLKSSVIGILWGAVLGPHWSMSSKLFFFLRWAVPIGAITFLALYFIGCKIFQNLILRSVVCGALGFIWSVIHAPQPLEISGRPVEVIWSQGCGDVDDDVIVRDHFSVYYARGSALKGDVVILRPNPLRIGRPVVETEGYGGNRGVWCEMIGLTRDIILEKLMHFPRDMYQWLSGFLLGRKSDLDQNLVNAFRNIGLLHLLVLSGGHLSAIAALSLFLIRFGVLVPYIFRRVSCHHWLVFWLISGLAAVALLFLYCMVVGFSPSVQRAYLTFFVSSVMPMLGLAHSVKTRVLVTFLMQAILFPVEILSLSLILSWCGTLLLMAFFESLYLKSIASAFLQAARIQLVFFATSLLFFGKSGILSPLANLLALLVFGFLLPFDMVTVALSSESLDRLLIAINRAALDGILWLDYQQSQLPLPFVSIPKNLTMDFPYGRLMIALVISAFYGLAGGRQSRGKRVPLQFLKLTPSR